MITAAQRAAVAALDLPFDLDDDGIAKAFDADGTALAQEARNVEDMHARATALATAAMEAVSPTAEEVAAFRAARQAEEDEIRAASKSAHEALLARRASEAADRRIERIANHQAHIASMKAGRKERKDQIAARHQASNDDRKASAKVA